MSQTNGSKKFITIEELFGDARQLKYTELLQRGEALNLTKLNIDLLIQHAMSYGALKQLGDDKDYGFELDPLPY